MIDIELLLHSKDTERSMLCMTNTEINGEKAYETNDLLMRHPTNKDLWKVYGRGDDQIMHSNGEKARLLSFACSFSNDLSLLL